MILNLMKSAMVFPSIDSEKAISNYSLNLVNAQNKLGNKMEKITYVAGSSKSLFNKINVLKNYDLIHIQHEYNLLGGFGLPFFFLYFYLRLSKVKVVTTMHTVLSQNEKFKSGKLKTFLRKVLYRTQNRVIRNVSDKIIVHANFFKDILEREYSIEGKKISVLPQAILEGVKTMDKVKAKKELKLSGPVYLVIGSLVPDHGADIVIRQAKNFGKTVLIVANNRAVNDRNDTRIADWLNFNKELVKQNKFEKYVRFDIKDLPDELWWKYFSAADVVILPYKGGIGSGIFADAIAARKPIIGSNIQFFNEFAKKWGFIKVAKEEKDFPKLAKEILKKENYSKTIKECERYAKSYGTIGLSKKYFKLYSSIK